MSLAQLYLTKTSKLIKKIYSDYTWDIKDSKSGKKTLYLTFDDGPTPEITDWVMEQLDNAGAKGTFFCIGEKVEHNPEMFLSLSENGHSIGNHTYSHLNGWDAKMDEYVKNIDQCEQLVPSNLFRPPYGKIKRSQAKIIKKRFRIIMWDVLSWDFRNSISPENCLKGVMNHAVSGSIIVFHDSLKAFQNLKYTLPRVLDHFGAREFEFQPIILPAR